MNVAKKKHPGSLAYACYNNQQAINHNLNHSDHEDHGE